MTTAELETTPLLARKAIEQRAADLLGEYDLDSIPVDLLALARRLGMAVNNAKFTEANIVGAIAKQSGKAKILVNQYSPPFQKQFTIAHELGHFFLHLIGDGDFIDREVDLFRQIQDDSQDITPEHRLEVEANLFAIGLLMPANPVAWEWNRRPSIHAMARRFNVSASAMGLRVGQLGLE